MNLLTVRAPCRCLFLRYHCQLSSKSQKRVRPRYCYSSKCAGPHCHGMSSIALLFGGRNTPKCYRTITQKLLARRLLMGWKSMWGRC